VGVACANSLDAGRKIEQDLESVHRAFGSHGQAGLDISFLDRPVGRQHELGRGPGIARQSRSDRKHEGERRCDDRELRPA
jgi:hypothetical protein